MTAGAVRDQIKARPFRPFSIKTADGDTFQVHHPDFAMISPNGTEIAIYDQDEHFRIVAMDLIVSVEPVREQKKKPGKR